MNKLRLAVSCAVLLCAIMILHLRSSSEVVPIRQSLGEFPQNVGDWKMKEAFSFDQRTLDVLQCNDYTNRYYADSAGHTLMLYIGYWESQRRGTQIHSPKNCLPGSGWEPVQTSKITIPIPPGTRTVKANQYVIQKDREKQVVLYWYQSRGETSAGEISALLQKVKNAIFYNRTDAALIRVSSPVYGNVPETTELLKGYVQSVYPKLSEYLPG